ncbi:MAG: RNA polymerase sigma-70 factor [Solitalea sp.]
MRRFTDDQLIKGLCRSDPLIFQSIYRLHWRKLYHVAFHIIGDEADAEDILQDVFCSLWYRRKRLRINTALENYLVRAVKYTAFYYLKKQMRQNPAVPAVSEPASGNNVEDLLFQQDLESMLNALLETFPFKTRRIFSLSRFQGLSYPEIAEEMGVSVKTVEYHMSKVLRRLSLRRKTLIQR